MIEIVLGIILAALILYNLDIAIELLILLLKLIVFIVPIVIAASLIFALGSMIAA